MAEIDLDLARCYFEELLFDDTWRLPVDNATWDSELSDSEQRLGLTLTNIRISLDDGFHRVAFVPDTGSSSDYLHGIDTYSGKAWMRLSVRNGVATQTSIGSKPIYRLAGVAFFQIFVRQEVTGRQNRSVHADIMKYVLGHKSARRRGQLPNGESNPQTQFTTIAVSPPTSSFGIDAVSDGWSQSNINFPYTQQIAI